MTDLPSTPSAAVVRQDDGPGTISRKPVELVVTFSATHRSVIVARRRRFWSPRPETVLWFGAKSPIGEPSSFTAQFDAIAQSKSVDNFTLIGVAAALAMDAFAVAASVAVSLPRWTARHTFRLSWHFGIFQAGMFLVGGFSGKALSAYIEQIDHWIAFGVLLFLGLRMIAGSFQPKDKLSHYDPTRGLSLVGLSSATSIDALAVGVSLGLVGTALWVPAVVIGLVALVLTAGACRLGRLVGGHLGKWAERLGGVVLIGIGFRILFQHLNVFG